MNTTDFSTINLDNHRDLDPSNPVLDCEHTRKISSVAAACFSAVGAAIGKAFSALLSGIKNSFAALITSIFQKIHTPKSEENVETEVKMNVSNIQSEPSIAHDESIYGSDYVEIKDEF